jgi:hypothetical protein
MYDLRNQLESLKKENQQLKRKLNLIPQTEEEAGKEEKYDFYYA